MTTKRNEVSYYPEIQSFIETQLKSNFLVKRKEELFVFWGIGELKSNLIRILSENPEKCACIRNFVRNVPPLNLDIFALVTNGKKFELLILEVKLLKGAGLKEWSQLVGYCLVSKARYGLLLNIDDGASSRLSDILSAEEHISHIRTIIGDTFYEHCLGFMQWDSLTQNFEYSNLGYIKSISDLSDQIFNRFAEN